eukprot:1149853-Pelagomonas_calceolata.AAC.7
MSCQAGSDRTPGLGGRLLMHAHAHAGAPVLIAATQGTCFPRIVRSGQACIKNMQGFRKGTAAAV